MKPLFTLVFVAVLFAFQSFTNDPGESTVNYKKGLIINLDEKENGEGCGWVIEIEGKYFKPKNLSKAFKKDSLKVHLDYDYSLTLYKCDAVEHDMQEILINWMEREK